MTFYIAIDGDDVGPAIREFIVGNNIEEVAQLSANLQSYFQSIAAQLTSQGAHIIFAGGDSVLATNDVIPTEFQLEAFYCNGPCTISIGIGFTAEVAYLALQLAKARGKNQTVLIDGMRAETIYLG